MLDIKGLLPTSLIEYPGKVSAVVFLNHCNFRCPYCQNASLALGTETAHSIPREHVLEFLKSRKKWLDGVAITGGEPTLASELPDFIKEIKALGLAVELETNGSNPEMLEELTKNRLVDYYAMDYKAPLDDYNRVCGIAIDKNKVKESAELIMREALDYEFRCTVVPGLFDERSALRIAQELKGARRFFLQQFQARNCLDASFNKLAAFPPQRLHEFAAIMRPFIREVGIRGA
ncbi:MAG: anaerobic ribonucleoside-triphosphate reductase activating protein [Candidatus Norongarragalinales archaeon]